MGDGGRRWLTYKEAGAALGIEPASAKRLSFRREWPHRAGNDGLARVGIPVADLHRATGDTHPIVPGDDSGVVTGATIGDATGGKPDASMALALALDRIEALAGQVGHARAEVAHLRAELAEAVRGRAAVEAAAARAERRAEEAAVDAWRIAADLAARLAAVQSPVRPPLAPTRRGGFLGRLLGR